MSTPVSAGVNPVDPSNWSLFLDFVQFILYVILGLYWWITNKDKATNTSIRELKEATAARLGVLESDMDGRMDKQEVRMARTEERIAHLPTRESIGKLHARLDELQKSSARQGGELRGIHTAVDRIQTHLLGDNK